MSDIIITNDPEKWIKTHILNNGKQHTDAEIKALQDKILKRRGLKKTTQK